MMVIPAVDIQNGKCVRLLQGRKDAVTVFSDDPAEMARKWAEAGAELIHVVDLDGAFEKKPVNFETIRKIQETVAVPIQVGGGIRDRDTIDRYLGAGVQRVVIGTEAIAHPARVIEACRAYPERIVIGIDARSGWVAIDGWTQTTRVTAVEVARRYEDSGVAAINFTDIHRDGMQTGPNLEATRRLAEAVSIPIIASGGVASLEDIQRLLPLEAFGVVGVITGKALYTGALGLTEAIAAARKAADIKSTGSIPPVS
jgi:phosphoribosylformimino-5-aminoimidazole carboxamide ribotide isomerase